MKGERVFSLGPIVHNDREVERLSALGLVSIDHTEFRKLRDCKVLIRAHGEPPETYIEAAKNNITIIEATCPIVKKLQSKIKETWEEIRESHGQVVIFGKQGHAEVVGLLGRNGCGKTSLGRGLLGLLPEAASCDGEIRFGGRNLLATSAAEMRQLRGPALGLIFQEPMTRLDPLMRISEHFSEALHTHEPELSDDEIRQRSLEALGAVGIPPTRFANYPHEFSGGMRQRIMIALTLALRPRFIVADEPTTSLDVLVEAQILSLLSELKARTQAGLLLITHNLGIVAEACDRVAVMYAGRIVEQGLVGDVFAHPRHPYTEALLASTISLSTESLHFIPGSPPDLVEPPPGCRFHPRCPLAMEVCRAQLPATLTGPGGHSVECWAQSPPEAIPPGGTARLSMKEIAVADEA